MPNQPGTKRKHILARKGIRDIPGWVYRAAVVLMKGLRFTWRVKIDDNAGLFDKTSPMPAIYACWHNRLMFIPTVAPRKFMQRTAGLASDSRDGEYAAQLLMAFGLKIVRGSTSKGGFRALVKLRKTLRDGDSIALTPDGPRGPRYQVQPGVIILAERTGCPIIPVSLNSKRHWELKGWDRTQIPKPFTSVHLTVGAPIHIPPDLSPEQREEQSHRIRDALMQITVE